MDRRAHWERVYEAQPPARVSWYEARPEASLALIAASGVARTAPIIDVGGGASTLVDHLLEDGYQCLTVLDVAGAALAQARRRLGERALEVTWLESDVLAWQPAQHYALWHDRALFHFLVDPLDRERYAAVLDATLAPHGQAIVAGFAADGPRRCSGLPVYALEPNPFGERFRTISQHAALHRTPNGTEQRFTYLHLARNAPAAAGT